MKYLLSFLLIALFTTASAQNNRKSKLFAAKAVELFEKAAILLRDGEPKKAIPLLQQSLQLDSNFLEANLTLAGAYGEIKDYQRAAAQYENAFKQDKTNTSFYYLPYSINLAGLGKYEAALQALEVFASTPNLSERSKKSLAYRKATYEFAINYAKTHPNQQYFFNPMNLGDSVNTARSEYLPCVTIEDSLIVFTRLVDGMREDFIESRISGNNQYTKWKTIPGSLNEEPKKGAITLSPDGEWMIFAADFSGRGLGSFDLYITYWTNEGWSEPVNLGDKINTEFWETTPSLSPDKRTLYFTSNRPGGVGGSDLYVSYMQPNGKWGAAENMGPILNSAGDEMAPFIHADNQTLYFTSSGHPGYGGADLFISRKQAGGTWSKPENLGYPINTIENDGSLAVAADGKTAYYSSNRSDSRGGLDLYTFELREDIRPYKTLYVKGNVFDAKTKQPVPASVELIDNSINQPLMKIQTDGSGAYFITLPIGKDYTFSVNRKGYLYYTEQYSLSGKAADSTYQKDIALQPVILNSTFVFNNIQFATASYQLLPISLVELDRLLLVMQENPTLKIQISGHTDNVGKADDNLKLSENRAKSVADYLMSKGVAAGRLSWKGFGATQPIADNTTESGRAKNRRTAFTITGL
ncbi:MAG: OmpA family protein [Chitinophagaceae bacterium]|nr:OmpA family protein [Chitinophagaceae bacterium]